MPEAVVQCLPIAFLRRSLQCVPDVAAVRPLAAGIVRGRVLVATHGSYWPVPAQVDYVRG